MSRTVDERVVEMRFDNKHFESNVATSMSTLDKLKQKLNLSGASKGLEDLDAASKKVNMSGLSGAVDTVKAKFSALDVAAVTALANITNQAVNAGKRMISALTIDPITTGFKEYETQINAVQTILANTSSKGTTLNQVNAALDELNRYADKTIYNFTEMTRNIGTFTAAGVDLKTSVSAIQGIANLAAVSGSTSQQASTAMYQLSQALSSGTVKLMDWNSVVNAGMGGQVFQDALKQTARVHGIAIDEMIEKQGSFRETLSEGWLTSEILTETLEQFTMAAEEGTAEWESYKKSLMDTGYSEEQAVAILKMANTATDAATKVKTFTQLWDTLKEAAQSGWTESWEIMVGDFEEAKSFLTDVSDRIGEIIGNSADARNAVLSEGLSSGWKQLLGAGIADEAGYKDIFKEVAKEYDVSIDDMIASEKKLDESLTDNEAFQKAIKKGFSEGTLSADMLTESVHKMAEKMSNMSDEELRAAGYTRGYVTQIQELSAGLKDGSISMDDFVSKIMRPSGRENIIQALWNAFDGLMSIIEPIKEAFRDIFPPITGEQVYKLTERIRDLTAKIKLSDDQASKLKSVFKGLFSILDIGLTAIKSLVRGAGELLSKFKGFSGSLLSGSASIGDFLSNLRDTIKETNFFGNAIDKAVSFLSKIIDKIKEFGEAVKSNLEGSESSGIFGFFKSLWSIVSKAGSAIIKTIGKIGTVISDIFAKGDILEVLNSGLLAGILIGINKFTSSIRNAFDDVGGFMENITGILSDVRGCLQAYQQQLKAGALLKIAAAIAILAAALYLLSSIDSGSLGTAVLSITSLFAELVGSMILMQKFGGKTSILDSTGSKLIKMSLAILILASALKSLSGLSWEQIAVGLVAVSTLLWELVAVSIVMSKTGSKMTKGSIGLILLSTAIKILASACKDFSNMSWESIGKGLAAVGGLLLEVSIFENIAGKAKHVARTGLSMVLIASSMKIFASVISDLSTIQWPIIAKGLTAIGIVLGEMAIAMRLMPKGSVFKSAGLVIAAASLKIIAKVMSDFGNMKWNVIAKGLVAIGGALAELAIGLNLMRGTLGGATSLMVASIALGIITPIIKSLAKLSWEQIAKGLITLAGAFAVIGLAGYILKPLIVPILGLAAAFALLGIGMIEIGAGLTLISAGITALAVSLTVGATSIVAALSAIIVGILELIPSIARVIGKGITEIAKVIGKSAPELAESCFQLLTSVLKTLTKYAPELTSSLCDLLIGVINSLADHMPALIEALLNLFAKVLQGLGDALTKLDVGSLRDGIDAAIGLGALVLAMSTALKIAGGISIGKALKGVLALTMMAIPLLAFVGVLALASGIDNAMDNALALSVLAGVCTVILGVLTLIGMAWTSAAAGIIALTAMAIPLVAFVGILALMNAVENAMFNAILIGTFMTVIADVLFKISLVAPLALVADVAIAGLILVIGAVGTLAVAIGALMEEFPSIQNFLDTGLPVLEKLAGSIGTMIGEFIGNLGESLSDSLVVMGDNIAEFMSKLAVASENASGIKPGSFDGVEDLMLVLLEIGGTSVGTTITDIFTLGGTSMEKFETDGVAFFNAMKAIGEASYGITVDEAAMDTVIGIAERLAALQSSLEPISGVVSWFTGRDDLGTFGVNAAAFIFAMKFAFGSLDGEEFNTAAMDSIIDASTKLSTLQSSLEPIGGVVSWFSGRDDLGTFGESASQFITSMKTAFGSLDGEEFNTEAMNTIVSAAQSLATLQSSLEPVGGVVSWFAGRDDLGTFGVNAAKFIFAMKFAFGSLDGEEFNTEAMNTIVSAAHSLSTLQSSLEPIGGVVSWFAGRDDLGTFGVNAAEFIFAMKFAFGSLDGAEFNTAAMDTIVSAAQSLATLQSSLEPIGGVVSWFAGRDDLGTFGESASQFVTSMTTAFGSLEGAEFNTEAMDTIVSAAQSLATLQSSLEPIGGVVSWFSGRDDLGTFGENVAEFADAMKKLKDGMGEDGISEAVVTSVINAGLAITELQKALPEEGWFDSKMDLSDFSEYVSDFSEAMAKFAEKTTSIDQDVVSTVISTAYRIKGLMESLADIDTDGFEDFMEDVVEGLGESMADFSEEVEDIDVEAVSVAVTAAQKLRLLISNLVGLDTSGIENFKPKTIGTQMKAYSDEVSGMNGELVASSVSSANKLRNLINGLADLNSSGIGKFKPGLIGDALKAYYNSISGINLSEVEASMIAASKLKSFISSLSEFNSSGAESFKKAVDQLALVNISGVVNAFSGASTKLMSAGASMISGLIKGMQSKLPLVTSAVTKILTILTNGIKSKIPTFEEVGETLLLKIGSGFTGKSKILKTAAETCASSAITGIRDKYTRFYDAGSYLVTGFCNGISENSYKAEAKAKAMAEATVKAAREALDINSPSKVFKEIGSGIPEGFAMGIGMLGNKVDASVTKMASSAINSGKKAMAIVLDAINSDMDSQPTIRPVVDLTDVKTGASAISGIFNGVQTVGVRSNLGAISTTMNAKLQNGSNDDVISAINKLNDNLENNRGDTYHFGNFTYDDSSNINDAVQTLVRAAIMGRRV